MKITFLWESTCDPHQGELASTSVFSLMLRLGHYKCMKLLYFCGSSVWLTSNWTRQTSNGLHNKVMVFSQGTRLAITKVSTIFIIMNSDTRILIIIIFLTFYFFFLFVVASLFSYCTLTFVHAPIIGSFCFTCVQHLIDKINGDCQLFPPFHFS